MKIIITVGKVLGTVLLGALAAAVYIYLTVLQYPALQEGPTVGKWYRSPALP